MLIRSLLLVALLLGFGPASLPAQKTDAGDHAVEHAVALLEEGRFDDAAAALRPRVSERPEDADLLWALTRAEIGRGAFESGGRLLERLSQVAAPPSWQAQCLWAQFFSMSGDRNSLAATADRLEGLGPDNAPQARSCAAIAANYLGNHHQARELIEWVRANAPEYAAPIAHLVLAYRRTGDQERAAELASTYRAERRAQLEEDSTRAGAHYALAELAAMEGDAAATVRHLRSMEAHMSGERYRFYWTVSAATWGDPIFDEVRGDPVFERFIARFAPDREG